jgi:hypothetical protein
MSKEKAQKNLNMTNILPSNILQATPANFLSIFPVSSVTSQWAVTHIKLRLIEP